MPWMILFVLKAAFNILIMHLRHPVSILKCMIRTLLAAQKGDASDPKITT